MTATGPDRYRIAVPMQSPAATGTVTPDLSFGPVWLIQMPAGNITIANPINAYLGDMLTLVILQDSIGARTVTWGSSYKKLVTLTITANARDSVTFRFDGTNWNQMGAGALALV
jgi:hypothetical protein